MFQKISKTINMTKINKEVKDAALKVDIVILAKADQGRRDKEVDLNMTNLYIKKFLKTRHLWGILKHHKVFQYNKWFQPNQYTYISTK